MADMPFQITPTDFAAPRANTRIEYMYRDASNYKQDMTAVLAGALTLEEALRVVACTDGDMGDSFLPALVGLDAADWSSDGDGAHYGDDHPWHELLQIEPTDAQPTETITAQQFLRAMEAAQNQQWETGHATKWKLKTDGKRARYFKSYRAAFDKASTEAVPYRIVPPLSEIFAED